MKRTLTLIGGGACGLLALALLTNSVAYESHEPLPETTPRWRAEVEPVTAPTVEPEPQAPVDPLHERLFVEASRIAKQHYAEADDSLLASWSSHYETESSFLFEGLHRKRFITVTTARVPCERVDRALIQLADPGVGRADRCARWRAKADEAMAKLGIHDRSPDEFLGELGAQTDVRVMLVYAGWERDGASETGLNLVGSESVPVYPQQEFSDRDYEARDRVYRAMKLGPYAEEQRTLAAN